MIKLRYGESTLLLVLPGHLIIFCPPSTLTSAKVHWTVLLCHLHCSLSIQKICILPVYTWSGSNRRAVTPVCHTSFYVCDHVCLHVCFVWPLGLFMSIYYVVSSRYASMIVFCLPCRFLLLSFISLTCPLCRLGLHSSIRWRSAWLSCTCGPPRAHSKSKVALITKFNLPLNNSPVPLTPSCSVSFCHHSLCFHTLSAPYLCLL